MKAIENVFQEMGFMCFRIRGKTCEALGPQSMIEKGADDWWNTRDYNKEKNDDQ